MRVVAAVVVSIVVLILVAGPGSAAEPSKRSRVMVVVTGEQFSEQPHISREVRVPLGADLVIKLSSNPGSTGFTWDEKPKMSDSSILKPTGHRYIEPKLPPGKPEAPGTPGNEVWEFKTLEPGKTVISMEYSRPWEGGEKRVHTFTLTVTVK
jgi:inhibitor of cysteine peptidase